jgi:hypothetical protein
MRFRSLPRDLLAESLSADRVSGASVVLGFDRTRTMPIGQQSRVFEAEEIVTIKLKVPYVENYQGPATVVLNKLKQI